MRVLQVIPAIAARYGGPSQLVMDLARTLSRSGIECDLVTTRADGAELLNVSVGKWLDYQGVRCLFFDKTCSERYKYSRGMSSWLKTNAVNYDLVHIHAVFSHSTLAAGRACLASGVPYVIRPLGSLDPWSLGRNVTIKKLAFSLGLDRVLRNANAIQYTSELEMQASQSATGYGNGQVVPNGVTLASKSCADVSLNREIVYVGRIASKKMLPDLLQAFLVAKARPKMADVKLVIAGSGDNELEKRLRSMAGESGFGHDVTFPGWLEEEARSHLFGRAAVVVLVSENENYGIAVVEAMAASRPVLVNHGVYLYPDIERAEAGWVLQDDETLADCLETVMEDASGRCYRGKNARKLVENHYAWEAVGPKMIALYRRVLGQ